MTTVVYHCSFSLWEYRSIVIWAFDFFCPTPLSTYNIIIYFFAKNIATHFICTSYAKKNLICTVTSSSSLTIWILDLWFVNKSLLILVLPCPYHIYRLVTL